MSIKGLFQKAVVWTIIMASHLELQCSGHDFPEATIQRGILEKKLKNIFTETDSLPLSISKHGIRVWTKWENSSMLALSEANFVPHHPNEFRSVLKDFSENFPKVNPMCENVINLKKEGDIREGVKSKIKFPFPLSDRLMIHWQYTHLDEDQDEHLVMFSEDGNDELLKEFHGEDEKKKYVLGRTFLCAYWIKPVYNNGDKENIIGSKIRYMFSGDTCGSVPKLIQNSVGPKSAFESIQGLVDFVKTRTKR